MGDGTKENPYTREDVLRLIKENGGKAEGLDLSGKVFERGIDLSKLNLSGIILEGASLIDSNLGEVDLTFAHLEGVHLESTNLEGAFLAWASLDRANLAGASLRGTWLDRTRFIGTHLIGVEFSHETKWRNVDWGNYILGEEADGYFGLAQDVYRRLKQWYTQSGYSDIAAKFYYREKEANRKALKLFSKSSWIHRLALELVYRGWGYGEGWKRILFGWIPVSYFS